MWFPVSHLHILVLLQTGLHLAQGTLPLGYLNLLPLPVPLNNQQLQIYLVKTTPSEPVDDHHYFL